MTPYQLLDPMTRGWFSVVTFLVVIAGTAALFMNYALYRTGGWFFRTLFSVLISWFMLQLEFAAVYFGTDRVDFVPQSIRNIVVSVPVFAVVLMVFGLAFYTAGLLSEMYARSKEELTMQSVRQGIDRLDTGICCYWDGGLIKLANPKMEALCRIMTGASLEDGEQFCRMVENLPMKVGERPAAILPDGTVYAFSKALIRLEEEGILNELIAADVTELWRLTEALEQEEEEQKQFNRRLRQLGRNIDETGARGEILSMKIRIHDLLGRALLATRLYLGSGSSGREDSKTEISGSELTALWNEAILFRNSESREENDERILEEVESAAEAIGLRVDLSGKLPYRDGEAMNLILSAARECLTNASRHADASVLRVTLKDAGPGFLNVEFRNDGKPPETAVREGGGLSSLRQLVESKGGRMDIKSNPEFSLLLKIPLQSGDTGTGT